MPVTKWKFTGIPVSKDGHPADPLAAPQKSPPSHPFGPEASVVLLRRVGTVSSKVVTLSWEKFPGVVPCRDSHGAGEI